MSERPKTMESIYMAARETLNDEEWECFKEAAKSFQKKSITKREFDLLWDSAKALSEKKRKSAEQS